MQVITQAKYKWDGTKYVLVSQQGYAYSGPWALADRAAQGMAKAATTEAKNTAGQYNDRASQINASLIPGLEKDFNSPTGYTPMEQSDMLTADAQGEGGALAGVFGQADLNAARTGNTAGYSNALDEAQRVKGRDIGETALGVKNDSAKLAQEKRMQAGKELSGLYGANADAALKGMGIENQDIDAYTTAGKSGWLQNMNDTITAVSGAANAGANVKKSFG